MEEVPKQLAEVRVVGLVVEAQRAAEVKVCSKLSCGKQSQGQISDNTSTRTPENITSPILRWKKSSSNKQTNKDVKPTWICLAENLNRRGHFLLADALVLLPLGGRFEALPRQRAQIEVHENVAQGLQVISSGLLCGRTWSKVASAANRRKEGRTEKRTKQASALTNTQMCVDGGIAGRSGEVLVLTVRDVLVRASVTVFLGQTKVDDVDQIALFAQAHQKVVWLHISVDEVLGVDVLDAADLKEEKFQS